MSTLYASESYKVMLASSQLRTAETAALFHVSQLSFKPCPSPPPPPPYFLHSIEAHELHFQCIQAEFNLLSSISPHPHILNLVGITVNFRRPSFLVQGASPSDPAGLLFEYPWYGRLFAFLSTKRRAIVAKNRSIWAPLEQQGPLSSELPYLLQAYLCDFAVSSSDAGRPFLKPLGDPLDDLDLCVFAMQITSAMEYLASKKV